MQVCAACIVCLLYLIADTLFAFSSLDAKVRTKEATNVRAASKDESGRLSPPKQMVLEELIGYMAEDEVIEVTPKSIRLRKQILDSNARDRASRSKAKQIRSMKK